MTSHKLYKTYLPNSTYIMQFDHNLSISAFSGAQFQVEQLLHVGSNICTLLIFIVKLYSPY